MNKLLLPFLFLLCVGVLLSFYFYGNILQSPNDYMFSDTGDGLKNYYTYSHHIAHGDSYTNFEGMNYPYGESYLYTDCHPVLANAFKFLSSSFPFFDTQSVGILNFLLLLSFFLSFLLVFAVLIEVGLKPWFGLLFAITIVLLAPQLYRLEGHLALSYTLAIPLSWWLIIKCLKTQKKRFIILLLLNNVFWMFIHAYLGVISLCFLLFIIVFQFLFDSNKKSAWWSYSALLATVIVPLLLFTMHAEAIDIHQGRTDNPSGFFLYTAEIDDILVPHDKPFRPLLDQLTGNSIKLQWEARGYVGFLNALLFVVVAVTFLISLFRKKTRVFFNQLFGNDLIKVSLLASLVALLFAMSIPFRQVPALVDWLPILKQFRATGRFVWPFYFAFTVFAAYTFQKLVVHLYSKNKLLGIASMLLLFSITFAEGVVGHLRVSERISSQVNLFNKNQLETAHRDLLNQIDPDAYQAIISLPFFYQGSESYSRPRGDEAMKNTLTLSYHTALPMVNANLTRTSIEESKRVVQLLSPTYYDKKIAEDLSDDRPFLIIQSGTKLTTYESALAKKAQPLTQSGDIRLLSLSKDALLEAEGKSLKRAFNMRYNHLIEQDGFLVSAHSSVLHYDGFDTAPSDVVFKGAGGFSGVKKGKNTLAEFGPNTFSKNTVYDFSIWMHNGEQDALNLWFRCIIEEYDAQTDQWYSTTFFPDQSEVINGDWSLVEGTFEVRNPKNKIYLVTKGKKDAKAAFHADELLIKESGVDVYRSMDEEGMLFFNNHWVQ